MSSGGGCSAVSGVGGSLAAAAPSAAAGKTAGFKRSMDTTSVRPVGSFTRNHFGLRWTTAIGPVYGAESGRLTRSTRTQT